MKTNESTGIDAIIENAEKILVKFKNTEKTESAHSIESIKAQCANEINRVNLFDNELYERIATYMVTTGQQWFEGRKGKYHVLVEWDDKLNCYCDGCADTEDDWAEIETNFDSVFMFGTCESIFDMAKEAEASSQYTYDMLRRSQ